MPQNINKQLFTPKLDETRELIDGTVSFTILGMPGVGMSLFLKQLIQEPNAHYILVNFYDLTDVTKKDFLKLLFTQLGGKTTDESVGVILAKCKALLKEVATTHNRVVIIFNRFDRLKKILSFDLIENLRSLIDINRQKISYIFASTLPIYEITPQTLKDSYSLFTRLIYLPPFASSDLEKIMRKEKLQTILSASNLRKAVELSGNHHALLQILSRCQSLETPLRDNLVKLQLQDIYQSLHYYRRLLVQKIAFGKIITKVDDYLLGTGIVIKKSAKYTLFSDLFSKFVVEESSLRLPVKEKKLYNLLRRRIEQTVYKDEIFKEIWGDDQNEATDWALNSLMYRLRKHPFFVKSGFIIENAKKQGYILRSL